MTNIRINLTEMNFRTNENMIIPYVILKYKFKSSQLM